MTSVPARDQQSALLRQTLEQALAYLERLPELPVGASRSLESLRSTIDKPLRDSGRDPRDVLADLVSNIEGGLNNSAGGRFFGWVIGGVVPAALAADWMTSTWDQNSGMFAVAPAAAVVEETCGRWLLELLGLPTKSSFALVTGCQMAHVTCLAAARHAVLDRHGWDVEQHGLYGAPPVKVITGDQWHGTIDRALRMLGMGRQHMVDVPIDLTTADPARRGKLTAEALEPVLAKHAGDPIIVLLQAGDLNTGSFDPFNEVIPLAHKYGAWVHVDGAFGLWVRASRKFRHLADGVDRADSWATDGHKWLNVPYDCGYAIVADRIPHYGALGHRASYLNHSDQARDQVDWNPEYSRRGRGFATYAAIESLGREGVEQIVDEHCRLAHRLVSEVGELEGVEVLCVPTINQGLVRFLDPAPGATDADHDRFTDAVTARIVESGEAFFACTTWRSVRCMRVSVSSWMTTDEDVSRTVAAVRRALLPVSA